MTEDHRNMLLIAGAIAAIFNALVNIVRIFE